MLFFISEALDGKCSLVEDEFEGIRYIRFRDSARGFRRGTVVFEDGTVVLGFPHIKRVVQLENEIRRVFKKEAFYVEEKVDGYNVRVIKVKDKALAITRGGFVCPFTTERIKRLAFYLAENHIRGEEFERYARALGMALLGPFIEGIHDVANGGEGDQRAVERAGVCGLRV